MNDCSEPRPGGAIIDPDAVDRDARNAALTLAVTLPGDTVLYLLLPVYAASFGVSLPEVGILLAANRLVRIFGNALVARCYALRGPRLTCTLAACGAVASTFGYALCTGLWTLLLARLLWGLSFAAMNIANQALPTAELIGAARRSGRARSIVAAGPMIGLVGGAVIAELWGPRTVFLLLGLIALAGPLIALRLPSTREGYVARQVRIAWPQSISLWSFSMGFTLDGLFIFGLSLLAAASVPHGAVLAAGVAMALRYLSEILLSPTGGALAGRVGARRLLIGLSLACSVALCLLGTGGLVLWAAVLATVVLRALMQPLPAPVIAEACPGPARVPALATQATWRDIGAGVGPLVAGVVFPIAPALAIYLGAGAMLAAASLLLARKAA